MITMTANVGRNKKKIDFDTFIISAPPLSIDDIGNVNSSTFSVKLPFEINFKNCEIAAINLNASATPGNIYTLQSDNVIYVHWKRGKMDMITVPANFYTRESLTTLIDQSFAEKCGPGVCGMKFDSEKEFVFLTLDPELIKFIAFDTSLSNLFTYDLSKITRSDVAFPVSRSAFGPGPLFLESINLIRCCVVNSQLRPVLSAFSKTEPAHYRPCLPHCTNVNSLTFNITNFAGEKVRFRRRDINFQLVIKHHESL